MATVNFSIQLAHWTIWRPRSMIPWPAAEQHALAMDRTAVLK